MANGKGSGRRPAVVPDAQVASEWERIFGEPSAAEQDLAVEMACHECLFIPCLCPRPTRRVGRYEDAVMHEVTVDHRLLRPAQPPVSPGWPEPQFLNSHVAPEESEQ